MRLLVLLLLPLTIWAEDARLDSIRALLEPMRKVKIETENRGATPALTDIKHLLRDWIETRLAALDWDGVRWTPLPTVLQEQLNDELARAGLFCGSGPKIPCPDMSNLGFLNPIVIEITNGVLVVRTSAGIQVCGADESAYAYTYDNDRRQWQRFWQTEQNDYDAKKYFPQSFVVVSVSPIDYGLGRDRSQRLILTMGVNPWCTSYWHPVYYRAWLTKASLSEPALLLDGSEMAHLAEPIHGRVGKSDVLMEYATMGPPGLGWIQVRHYLLQQDRLVRADPVATSPNAFVFAWLGHPWDESSLWSSANDRKRLEELHREYWNSVDEIEPPAMRCRAPDLWQVSTLGGYNDATRLYFRVRWEPPYHFTMVSVSTSLDPGCDEKVPQADNPPALFSDQ